MRNSRLFARAKDVIPGGVNSPVRSFRSVGGEPYFVKQAKGAYVIDEDKNRYIDFVQSYGPTILGHAPKKVVQAASRASRQGLSFGAPTEREVLLAEEISGRVDGLEMLRLVSSGTEAAMTAIRVARGATGRNQILKFAGCYHGHADALLAAGGSGVANQGLSDSAGVTPGAVGDTIVAPYNQIPELTDQTAAVIVEPVAANMGLVAPKEDFLSGLREACNKVGALLIFDEIITGFRMDYRPASDYFGVTPDLWCFGKVIGGGLPLGAFGGKASIMQNLAPLGDVYQAGTLSGNPVATAAGLAALKQLTPEKYEELKSIASQLSAGLTEVFFEAGMEICVPQVGTLLGIFFTKTPPQDFDSAKKAAENGIYPRFFQAMLKQGVAFAPGPYEAVFVSLAHKPKHIDAVLQAAKKAASAIALESGA